VLLRHLPDLARGWPAKIAPGQHPWPAGHGQAVVLAQVHLPGVPAAVAGQMQ
jgi:hypothetical protein